MFIPDTDWLTQQGKRKTNEKVFMCVDEIIQTICLMRCVAGQASTGRKEKSSQGKSSSEKGRTKTYLMATHRKKREQVMANNLDSDEVDPEIQVYTLCV